ncbi:MAG TPA: hypothetical protein VFM05_07450, partial [Candidatus Saccharimonadales bacterium]|nr:hypothetical protein [Candidatus Saccharimonadales bacterium]
VYAYRNNQQLEVRVGMTRTRPISEAAKDLQYIRGLALAEPGSRIFGRVGMYTYRFKENNLDTELYKT